MINTTPANIVRSIETMLQSVNVANGYHTDAGSNVHILKQEFDEALDAFPAFDIGYGIETQSSAVGDHKERLDIVITGFIRVSPDSTLLDALESLDRDIKKAISIDEIGAHTEIARPVESVRIPPEGSQKVARVAVKYAITYYDQYGT